MIPLALVFFLKILRVAQLVKNLPSNVGDVGDVGLIPGLGRKWQPSPLEEEMATHSSILPGESHGRRSMVGCSP